MGVARRDLGNMETESKTARRPKPTQVLESVVIRFAGDSGDGMQLTGTQFTATSAAFGNDLATLPDFPAEIRAPAGTLPGVSGFQIHFSSAEVSTPGDSPDVLVAMNPAALKVNLREVKPNGVVIVNTNAFAPLRTSRRRAMRPVPSMTTPSMGTGSSGSS